MGLFGLFAEVAGDSGEAMPDAKLPAAFAEVLEPMVGKSQTTTMIVGVLAVLSLAATLLLFQRCGTRSS